MTGHERASRALSCQPVDRVPIWGGWITGAGFLEYLTGQSYWENPREVLFNANLKLGVDLFPGEVYGPFSPEEFRVGDYRTLLAASRAQFRAPEDVLTYIDTLPSPDDQERAFDFEAEYDGFRAEIEENQERLGDRALWLPEFRTCYFNWHVEFGNENFFLALGLYPEAMRRLFEFSGVRGRLHNEVRVRVSRDLGLPPVMFNGVDLADNRGPLVNPRVLRESYFPYMKYSMEPLVEAGMVVVWHADGNFVPLIPDLVDCGVRGFQGFQEEAGVVLEDLPQIALPTGRKPALWGSLSVTRTLPFGTVEDVKREVERCIDVLAPGGGYFLGTANTVGPEVPFENLLAMHEHAQDYGGGRSA